MQIRGRIGMQQLTNEAIGAILLVQDLTLLGVHYYAQRETDSLVFLETLDLQTKYKGRFHENPLLGELRVLGKQLGCTKLIMPTIEKHDEAVKKAGYLRISELDGYRTNKQYR